jgi:regulator of PEP synthase PpsR (kinase-PPPase family)
MNHLEITRENPLTVYTLSDASGQTAELMAKAVVSQFQGQALRLVRLPRVVNSQQLGNMIQLAAQGPSLLAYTIARADLLAALEEDVAARGLVAVDMMAPMIEAISKFLGTEPLHEPGLTHARDEEYFRRMEAIEFAIKYDDGKSPQGLARAELVLVGVSRTSKTPTCMYLAQNQGIRCCNVPLVPSVAAPKELFALPPGRVIGLTVKPNLLTEIRGSRLATLGLPPDSAYANQEKIKEELAYADDVFRRLRCPVVDVTYKAIEETASEILAMTSRKEFIV